MPPANSRVGAFTLAREDIRALPRQTFAMGTIAVLLGLVTLFAAFAGEGSSAMRDQLMFFWVVAQLVVAIVLAARIASARRTRFVDSLYTTPLEARTWLAAQLLVGAFLALLVLLAQLPFLLVHVAFAGMPAQVPELFLAALGVAAFAVAFGAFCGVIVGDAGPGAAAGLAGGVGFASFFMLLVNAMAGMGVPTPTKELVLRITAISPLAMVVQATGIDIFGITPEAPWRPALGLAALVLGFGGAAWIAYTRAQGPLGWEPRRARVPVVALVVLALVLPVGAAATAFKEIEDGDDEAFSHGDSTRISFVPRGAAITDDAFALIAPYHWEDLVHDRENELDVLVMLLVPADEAVRNVRIEIKGSDTLRVVSGGRASVPDGEPDGKARMGVSWNEDEEPPGPFRPVYRVPVTVRPVEAQSMKDSPSLVHVETTYFADGSRHESRAHITLDTNMPGASAALALAGAPLPLAALAALVTRRFQIR